MIWGNDSDMAGPITVEGTGEIPTAGLYDTVYNWDMRVQFADGVRLTFKTGAGSTKFIGSDGWIRLWRGGIDAEPKSLLTSKIGPNDVHLCHSSDHCQNFIDAVKSQAGSRPGGSHGAKRHHQPSLRYCGPHQAEDHLGPPEGIDCWRR